MIVVSVRAERALHPPPPPPIPHGYKVQPVSSGGSYSESEVVLVFAVQCLSEVSVRALGKFALLIQQVHYPQGTLLNQV